MMSERLSPTQIGVLANLRHIEEPACAYELRCSMATLYGLFSRGLVSRKDELGSLFSPRTNVIWELTPAGVDALVEKAQR